MSLKHNIAANYVSQLYTTLIGIVLVPVYLKTMGSEAYGLVGFFAMLQAWFNLLDLGLTPTISRESARFRGGAMSALAYRRVYRSLSLIFASIAVLGGAALFGAAGLIATRWLNLGQLPEAEATGAVQVMALCVALRWMGGLYRGVISGAERLVWLGGFNAVIATLRFVAVVPSMWLWGFTPAVFFWHQLVVAVIEWLWLMATCRALLPAHEAGSEAIGWSFRPVLHLLRFSMTIAFTSSVWVLVTQTDKLILSGILPLAEYGYFTLAVLVAGGITIVSGPISTALLPRLARLHAEGKGEELRRLYHQAAQLVSVVAGSIAVLLAVCPEPLLFAWSGSQEMTNATAPVLRLYAIGNGLLSLGAFPFYLQYARGDLRYHLVGNLIMVSVLIPAIVLAALHAGGIGAGWVWLSMNALYLLAWVAYVHGKLEPGLHWRWLRDNVLRVLLPTAAAGWALSLVSSGVQSRWLALVQVMAIGAACMIVAILASPALRPLITQRERRANALR